MARDRERRRSARAIDPDDVIAGRVMPGARELIDLIHEVNPTGLALSAREASRRYAQKARLQSSLIERFRDELTVEAGSEEGVITLRHRYLGLDACHAVVAELDEDARSWVRLQIDIGAAATVAPSLAPARRGSRPSSTPQDGSVGRTVGDLLAAGRRALDEYDFDAARQAFGEAHDIAPDDLRPVLALLTVLITELGLDHEALAFADDLGRPHLDDARVRGLLALAAARTHDLANAERLIRGLEDELAADAHRAICSAALDQHDLDAATRAFEAARRAGPGSPDLPDLQRRLRQARGSAVAGQELRLRELDAGGQSDAALSLAREVLRIDPENAAARLVLKRAAQVERAAQEASALARLQAALAAGDLARARIELDRLREAGASAEDVSRHAEALAHAEREQRARRAAERVEAAVEALTASTGRATLERGLRVYVRLGAEERRQVRSRCPRDELEWLDAAGVEGDGPRTDRIVSAVLAIGEAEAALRGGDPATAAALLESHAFVGDLRVGRTLTARIHSELALERRARALAGLEEAVTRLAAHDVIGAAALLDSVTANDLDDPGKRRLEAVRAQLVVEGTVREERRRAEELLSTGDLPGARRRFERLLAAIAGTPDEASVAATVAAIDTRLRDDWVVLDHRLDPGKHVTEAPEMSPLPQWTAQAVRVGLRPGGEEAVLASNDERFVFVRYVDVDSGELRRVLVLRTPEPMRFANTILAGDSVWVIGYRGAVLQVSCGDGLPRTWTDLGSFLRPEEVCEDTAVVPGARTVWLGSELPTESGTARLQIIDIDERRLLRTFEDTLMHEVIIGSDPPMVARREFDAGARVLGGRGAALADIALPAHHDALAVARHPSGRGFVSLSCEEDADEDLLVLVATDESGAERSRVSVAGCGEVISNVATDLRTQLTYLFYSRAGGDEDSFAAVAEEHGRLVIRTEAPIAGISSVVQDERATATVCIRPSPRGRELVRLRDAAPPRFKEPAVPRLSIPEIDSDHWCSPVSEAFGEREHALANALAVAYRDTPATERPGWARANLKHLAREPRSLLVLARTIAGPELTDVSEEVLTAAEALAPDDPYVALARVELDHRKGRWTGEALLDTSSGRLREHLLHLEGLVLLRDHKYDQARAVWASASQERCALEPLIELATALAAVGRGETSGSAEPGLAALVTAVLHADRLLAAGQPAAARALLDVAWIRDCREEQSLARLVAAFLDEPPPAEPLHRFRMAAALAAFVADFAQERRLANRIPLGPRTWDRPRIEELGARAAAWLRQL